MPRHRARASTTVRRRRPLGRWQAACLAGVVLVLIGWAGWAIIGGDHDPSGARCSGETVLKVAVSPSAEEPVRQVANRWNGDRIAVDGRCVKVNISSVASVDALNGLTGDWSVQAFGDRPHAWLPESSLWTDRLAAADEELLASAPESVATSPVVLAAPEEAARALNTNPPNFTWAGLSDLVSDTAGWSRFGHADWGRLTVAMPSPATNPATGLAVQAALIGHAKQSPLTPQILARTDVGDMVAALAAAQPEGVPETSRAAMVALGDVILMRNAPYSAAPVLEIDLYRRNLAVDGRPPGTRPLFEIAATDQSPAADFPFVSLTGVPPEVEQAAYRFREFLLEPEAQREFGRAGLRTDTGERPPDLVGMTWSEQPPPAAPADRNTTQQIAATWANAVEGGQIVTLMVDVSRSMGDVDAGGRSRLDLVKETLHGYTDYTVSGSIGLWRFAGAGRGDPYAQLVPTGPIGDQRTALRSAIDTLTPDGGTELYESVAAAYRSASDRYAEGRRNQIVVITDGGDDGSMSLGTLKARMKDRPSTTKPLPVHVIVLGREANRSELRELARTTGGTVSILADAEGVRAALGQLASTRE